MYDIHGFRIPPTKMITNKILLIQASAVFILGMCMGATHTDIPDITRQAYLGLNDTLPRNGFIEYLLIPYFFVAIVTVFIGGYVGFILFLILGENVWSLLTVIGYFPILLTLFYILDIIKKLIR